MAGLPTTENLLVRLSQTKGGSDLIITAGRQPQLRVYTQIIDLDFPELTPKDTEWLCMSVLNEEQKERFKNKKEIDISLVVEGAGRFRVNIYRQRRA